MLRTLFTLGLLGWIEIYNSEKGRKRRLSESHQKETDENLDNIQVIAVENKIDSIVSINMDHSYAFPSDIVVAKAKYYRLQSLIKQVHLKEKKQGRKLHNACLKKQNKKLELNQVITSIKEKELLQPQIFQFLKEVSIMFNLKLL
ncbi:unnamed protein product [Lepeophtheirus salmonis]|uniref:(salmon louse) hypothetical protein n=1 Tax=Lepeophtheirus salmonis TaxID=72036 RepID=A0A7R8CN64_LEPSM|nr:unnamed protein product [Lepeophtheirus salmonis]CAF2872308.1 unnamed protein product [Lepeophtheirus salmonis]